MFFLQKQKQGPHINYQPVRLSDLRQHISIKLQSGHGFLWADDDWWCWLNMVLLHMRCIGSDQVTDGLGFTHGPPLYTAVLWPHTVKPSSSLPESKVQSEFFSLSSQTPGISSCAAAPGMFYLRCTWADASSLTQQLRLESAAFYLLTGSWSDGDSEGRRDERRAVRADVSESH